MTNFQLYSRAERMGFFQKLLNKFKGKKPEGRTSKEREMIAIDETIQSKLPLLNSFFESAKSYLDANDVQRTFVELIKYYNTLQEMLQEADPLIQFGITHKISRNKLILLLKRAAQEDVTKSTIMFYKGEFKKFLKQVDYNLSQVTSFLTKKLAKQREEGDVTNYIVYLKKLKEEIDAFNVEFNNEDSVIVKYKAFLQNQPSLSRTLKDMSERLMSGPKEVTTDTGTIKTYNPPPDVIQSEYLSQVAPTSDVARKMREVQQYRQNIGTDPYSSYTDLDEDTMFTNIHPKQMQLRPPVKEMPSYLDSGKPSENPLMSVAYRISKKYGD